jgi:DNA-binding CsgD family transcriptional regulator
LPPDPAYFDLRGARDTGPAARVASAPEAEENAMSWTAAEVAGSRTEQASSGAAGGAQPVAGWQGGPGWRIPVPRTPLGTEPARVPAVPRPLSDRDRELLAQLARGRSTAQIARAMSISTNTARTRIRRVSSKLAVDGRHEVVQVARELDLV